MYKKFYGLTRNPFEISPDPYFFCHTPRHNEALASLSYGVASKGEMLMQINNYLIDRYRHGSTAVLIVDEAHLLSWELLEEIRLLTNLETAQQKLLQIILVGQPELDRKLDSENLRQLKQRIALRCQLLPLDEPELRTYVTRRLQRAGSQLDALKGGVTMFFVLADDAQVAREVLRGIVGMAHPRFEI